MSQFTPDHIIGEYWSNKAKNFIAEKLMVDGLENTTKDQLLIFYNQITPENGSEILEKTKRTVSLASSSRNINIDTTRDGLIAFITISAIVGVAILSGISASKYGLQF